jgi:hypothetical protein
MEIDIKCPQELVETVTSFLTQEGIEVKQKAPGLEASASPQAVVVWIAAASPAIVKIAKSIIAMLKAIPKSIAITQVNETTMTITDHSKEDEAEIIINKSTSKSFEIVIKK